MHDRPHSVGSEAVQSLPDWLSAFDGLFSVLGSIEPGEYPSFEIWSGASTVASISSCQKATLLRMPRPIEGRVLDHVGLRFVLSGLMKLGDGEDQEVVAAGDGFFIDLSQPLRLEYAGQDVATVELTLWLPRAMATAGRTTPAFHGCVFRSDQAAASVLNSAVRTLRSELSRLSPGELDQLVAGLYNLAGQLLPVGESPPSTPSELESFAAICGFIEANLAARDLGVERLARTFGLSRASLYRLFEPVGGVASYVRAQRLNRARQELQRVGLDNRRIGPIAYQCGFRSVTAFNRAFREAYGETPGSARERKTGPSLASNSLPDEIGILARRLLEIC